MSDESPQTIYAKNLRQSFGYPLRFPEPKPGLPASYAENGLHIGDVGYVDADGMFNVLFNICLPPDHQLHQERQNDLSGFVGLSDFNPNGISPVPNAFPSGRIICHGVQSPPGGNIKQTQKLIPCSTSGAILVLPSGALLQKLDENREDEFRRLAEKYARKWHEITGRTSLYLITGFYKTSSWHLASFHGVPCTNGVLLEHDDSGRYTWDPKCDYRQSLEENHNDNQTVLVSGFKVEVRGWNKHILIERLSVLPRSTWSELSSLASFLLGILLFFLQQMLGGKLFGHGAREEVATGIRINRVPASSSPFHPSDIINRYLLHKNPNVRIAITHDSQWLNMLKENEISHEDMVEEECFWEFLESSYAGDSNSDCVAYLQRRIPREGGPYKLSNSCDAFSIPIIPDDTRQLVVTHMRAEKLDTCLDRMPTGFFVTIQFNGIKRRSACKPISLHDSTIEWDDEIVLPTGLMVNIQFSIIASYEFEPILGNGEILCMMETSMDEFSNGESTHLLISSEGKEVSRCPSLLLTLEDQRVDSLSPLCRDGNLKSEHHCLASDATDEGHSALLQYHRGAGIAKLLEGDECFKLALSLCPPYHGCLAAALCNHAIATFIKGQVHGMMHELDAAVALFRNVLVLRPDYHPDRPRSLLHLARALLCRQRVVRYDTSLGEEIMALATEIRQICPENSYDRRAADLVVQTLKRYQVLACGTLVELDELVSELSWSARIPPEWHFDRPCRLMNLSLTLHSRFGVTGRLGDLEKSISVTEKALLLVSDDHVDKPWMLTFLGRALCARFTQRGDSLDLDRSITIIEDALNRIPDGHMDKPWVFTSLGNALQVRFTHHSDASDLASSISLFEDAVACVPDDHPEKSWMHASLGDTLRLRFMAQGVVADLDGAISTIKVALKIPSSSLSDISRPHWQPMLAFLGRALFVRFAQFGDVADLASSISMVKAAVDLTPDGYPDKPWMLSFFGTALLVRFLQCGNPADLDDSIFVLEHALEIAPDGQLDKPWIHASLGDALRTRFVQQGNAADLVKAISEIEEGLKIASNTYCNRPRMTASLGNALRVRFIQYSSISDLYDPISLVTNELQSIPYGYFDKSSILGTLGDAHYLIFVQTGDTSSLKSAIYVMEKALQLAPDSQIYKPSILASLADALYARFVLRGDGSDLDSTISRMTSAIELAPDGHVEKSRMLTRLGAALLVRFSHDKVFAARRSFSVTGCSLHFTPPARLQVDNLSSQSISDLEKAISSHRNAANLLLNNNPHKPVCLTNLAIALFIRFQCFSHPSDLHDAVSKYWNAVQLVYESEPMVYPKECFGQLGVLAEVIRAYTMLNNIPNGCRDKSSYLERLSLSLNSDGEQVHALFQVAHQHTSGNFPCKWRVGNSICRKYFVEFDDLMDHLFDAHNVQGHTEESFSCHWFEGQESCNRQWNQVTFVHHIITHLDTSVPCITCGQHYSRADSMWAHWMVNHSNSASNADQDAPSFIGTFTGSAQLLPTAYRISALPSCNPVDQADVEYAQHRYAGQQCLYRCRFDLSGTPCNKWIVGDRTRVLLHLRNNHRLQTDPAIPATCRWDKCTHPRAMKQENLSRHVVTHLGVKWKCPHCERLFSRDDAVRRHIERTVPGLDVTEAEMIPGREARAITDLEFNLKSSRPAYSRLRK